MAQKKLYKFFKAKNLNDKWHVVTEDEEIIIATVPTHIRNQKVVAMSLAKSLSEGRFALADLI